MTKRFLSIAVLALLAITAPKVIAQSGYDLFQKALATERADGNLRGAIQMYERVVKEYPGDRALVARALVRIAECHEKLGQRDAAKYYERVVREFGDQAESVTLARARLGALQSPVATAATQTTRELWKGPEVDALGSPSADGRYLSATDWSTGDLALRDLAAGTSRRLTNTGGWEASGDYAEFSLLSPDAKQIAYAWFNDQSPKLGSKCVCRYDLRLMHLEGPEAGRPRVLLSSNAEWPGFWVRPAAWLPDGKGLLVVREMARDRRDLVLFSLTDNSVRSLRSLGTHLPARVSLSADGETVALDVPAAEDTPAKDIVLLNLRTGQQIVAVQNPAHDHSPLFSADGNHLLFLSDRTGTHALWRIGFSNGKTSGDPVFVSIVAPNSGLLGATRNGAVYYNSGGASTDIYAVPLTDQLNARSAPALAIERFVKNNTSPALSPDGRSLAYMTRRAASGNSNNTTLVIHTFAAKQDRQIALSIAPTDGVKWFPDSRTVLLAALEPQARRFIYYRVDIATGTLERLTNTQSNGIPARRPQLSPDGRKIFFAENVGDTGSRLVRFDIDAKESLELRVFKRPEYVTSIAASPDDTEVAVLRFENGMSILEIIPAGGGPARELFREENLTGSRYSGLAWSPDKRYILFVRNGEGATGAADKTEMWKVPVAGGAPTPVGIKFDGTMRFPVVDQANSRLIFAASSGGDSAILSLENFLPKQ